MLSVIRKIKFWVAARSFLILAGAIVCIFIIKWRNILAGVAGNKELVTAFSDIVAAIALIIGGILAYFRFFKGRTFSAKADIEFEILQIPSPHGTMLQLVKFYLCNKGTTTIWQPIARLGIRYYKTGQQTYFEVKEGIVERSVFDTPAISPYYMVDPGEKVLFVYEHEVDNEIWAVAYDVEINSKKHDIWKSSTIVSTTKGNNKSKKRKK